MSQLPPLPLIDGALFVDNSAWIESLSLCHRLAAYRVLHQRIPAATKVALHFGSALHLALGHRFFKYGVEPVGPEFYNEVADLFAKHFVENPTPVDDWRNVNWAMQLVKRYMQKYESEEFNLLVDASGKRTVEMSFALELYRHRPLLGGAPIPIIYSGRIDLPLLVDDAVWVMDHKTTSMLGPTFFDGMRMSSQQRGYCFAFEQLTKRNVAGFVVNAIRTKEPPLYVQQGKTWRSGTKSQTPEQWWNESFQRERFILKPGELDEWKQNTIALVEEFFWNYYRGYMPMKTALACTAWGRCPYYDVCTLAPEDRGLLLASGLFTDNKWSPLVQPSQSKQ